MNATEAIALCRYVKAACPQQAIDEYTPRAWADLLDGARYVDAHEAAKSLCRRQTFVSPAEILEEVHRIRDTRCKLHGPPIPPYFEDVAEEIVWMRDAWRRIGDGETIGNVRGELKPRPTIGILAGRRMEDA